MVRIKLIFRRTANSDNIKLALLKNLTLEVPIE